MFSETFANIQVRVHKSLTFFRTVIKKLLITKIKQLSNKPKQSRGN